MTVWEDSNSFCEDESHAQIPLRGKGGGAQAKEGMAFRNLVLLGPFLPVRALLDRMLADAEASLEACCNCRGAGQRNLHAPCTSG